MFLCGRPLKANGVGSVDERRRKVVSRQNGKEWCRLLLRLGSLILRRSTLDRSAETPRSPPHIGSSIQIANQPSLLKGDHGDADSPSHQRPLILVCLAWPVFSCVVYTFNARFLRRNETVTKFFNICVASRREAVGGSLTWTALPVCSQDGHECNTSERKRLTAGSGPKCS